MTLLNEAAKECNGELVRSGRDYVSGEVSKSVALPGFMGTVINAGLSPRTAEALLGRDKKRYVRKLEDVKGHLNAISLCLLTEP